MDYKTTMDVPGPGHYEEIKNKLAPSFTIPKQMRKNETETQLQYKKFPGVGTYNVRPSFPDVPAYALS